MPEYIEREALIAAYDTAHKGPPGCARRLMVDAPAADVAPVVHGRWEDCDWVEYDGHGECIHYPHEGRVCTNCRNAFKKEFINNPRVNYCPHCGARMDR